MRRILKRAWYLLVHCLAVVTDWMLIAAGMVLLYFGVFSIDVRAAAYVVAGSGILLAGAGSWYRHRRKRRCRC